MEIAHPPSLVRAPHVDRGQWEGRPGGSTNYYIYHLYTELRLSALSFQLHIVHGNRKSAIDAVEKIKQYYVLQKKEHPLRPLLCSCWILFDFLSLVFYFILLCNAIYYILNLSSQFSVPVSLSHYRFFLLTYPLSSVAFYGATPVHM